MTMNTISADQWNSVLDAALGQTVILAAGAQLPDDFRDSEFPMPARAHLRTTVPFRRGTNPPLSTARATYLLSMVAFEWCPFSCLAASDAFFYAHTREHFVVGVVGPQFGDKGRGRFKAVERALDELERLAR